MRPIAAASILALLLSANAAVAQDPPATMRVDFVHSGDAKDEQYALERVLIEPLPWPGHPARHADETNRGDQKFEVLDAASGKLLYSRGYSTIFGEWQQTDEAKTLRRAFGESLRFPAPQAPVTVRVLKRDKANAFEPVWSFVLDPADQAIVRKPMPASIAPLAIHESGPPAEKVDLLILGDGYTQAETDKFERDARRLSDYLFSVSPFKEREGDFNVWGLMVPTPESGVSRPSTGDYHASALGSRYDIFGSERYVLALDNRALRDIAQQAPYEFIEILVNNQTYGGGGIFGAFSTAAADSDWANYLFVHEFGHHFAGLADEYYTSPVAYAPAEAARPEPWEPNATASTQREALKWRHLVDAKTKLPTSWRKAAFEKYSRSTQKRRAELRAKRRPEKEMNALFREELATINRMFASEPNRKRVGLFEGAKYEAQGYYRPQLQCLMFDRSERFCRVCSEAVEQTIDLYSRPPTDTSATAEHSP